MISTGPCQGFGCSFVKLPCLTLTAFWDLSIT
jgi:hypothetical protein